jgi:site-specific DNA recombinase
MLMETMEIGIYARLSFDKSGASTATTRQIQACRQLVDAKGWHVRETYEDREVSAYQLGVVRPQFERLLSDLDQGLIQAVVVWKLDRLCRRLEDLLRVSRILETRGAALVSVVESVDTSTASGRFMLRTMIGLAEMESANISLRTAAQRAEAARKGRPNVGGARPFGYAVDKITVIGEEAEAIREAVRRFIAGEGIRGIAMDFNKRGILTPKGGKWTQATLRRALATPRLIGQRVYKGEVVGEGGWPAIVDRDVFEEFQALLLDPTRRTHLGRPRRYLLVGGMARCGHDGCDSALQSRPNASGTRAYVCYGPSGREGGGKLHLGIVAEPLEELVAERMLDRLDGPRLAEIRAGVGDEETRWIGEQLAQDEAALAELAADYYQRKLISRREFFDNRAALEEQVKRTRATLAKKGRAAILAETRTGEDLRQAWEHWGVDQRRALLESVLAFVTVMPSTRRGSRRFDPDRLVIPKDAWKV